ncbi:glycine betaine ABC transporter substrate-binding protein, partial [Xanthomonas citri]
MMARAFIAVVLLICGVGAQAAQVTIGSKNFTEAVILGEIATAAGKRDGVDVQHRAQLGGTRILWRALETGQIDAYAEYTGTLAQELLQLPNA